MVILSLAAACQPPVEESLGKPVVVLPEGTVLLHDTQLGMYYGNINKDGLGLFSIVLSDARCYQDELGKPYLDSEGDMLVLNFKTPLLGMDDKIVMPEGVFPITSEGEVNFIDASTSYVTRLVGNMHSKWTMESGSVSVTAQESGDYLVKVEDLVIRKGDVQETMDYVFNAPLEIADYMVVAPTTVTYEDDLIDMPFANGTCVYNGDLFGQGTGNFIFNLSTKGFSEYGEVPGVFITLNFFSRLYSGNVEPVLEAGKYTISSTALAERWTLLPGLLMDDLPFGSYVLQVVSPQDYNIEYIRSGVVEVSYDEDAETSSAYAKMCTITYTLKTLSRDIIGSWTGEVLVDNQATGSNESYLTTLTGDVECDMSKVTSGTLRLCETLHRENVNLEWDYDIAEAWQLYLQPRDWTKEEKDIPWLQDDNNNGIPDRVDAWCQDGDIMVLEFVLPLGSRGVIAPELNKTYTYTLQPSLAVSHEYYEIYVSRMGRPYDEIFDPYYAAQHLGWAENLGITSYDRCNARRGFTWSEDSFRGNWYLHYETNRHGILDGHAPAVNGWVKVTRTGDNTYDFEWEFIDDYPGTPNQIKGELKNCTVNVQL